MKSTVIALALAAAATPVLAQQPVAPAYLGIGNVQCTVWNQSQGTADARYGVAWLEGFITGFNITGLEPSRNVSAGVNSVDLTARVTAYCQQNPQSPVATAATLALGDLVRGRGYEPTIAPPLPRRAAPPPGR